MYVETYETPLGSWYAQVLDPHRYSLYTTPYYKTPTEAQEDAERQMAQWSITARMGA